MAAEMSNEEKFFFDLNGSLATQPAGSVVLPQWLNGLKRLFG